MIQSDLAKGRLEEFLRQQFPELKNLKILEMRDLGEGWETDLYHLKLEATQNGELATPELVLRLYKGSDPLEKAKKEFSMMTGMARYEIATPRVDALVTDISVLEHPFIVMEHVQGGTLEMKIKLEGASPWLDPMLETLVRIHRVPWAELNSQTERPIPTSDDPLAYVRGMLDEMEQIVEGYGLDDFEPMVGWLGEREVMGSATEPVLLHNDYHPQNILLRDNSLVVIDWSFAEVGDFRIDLAWTVLLFGVMAGGDYRAALLDAYERAAGSPVENLEFFEALKFGMRMVTIGMWLDEGVEIPVAGITKQTIRGDYKIHVMNPYRRLKEITGLGIRTMEEL